MNFNASGVTDRRVWAIRIKDGKRDKKKPDRVGYTSGGSPSPWTLVMILTDNIETIVDQGYAERKADYEKQRQAQYEARAKEYDKKAEEAKKNGNAGEEKKFRTKARNERTKGQNYKWNVNKVSKDSAIELIIHNAIAHEILHNHAINHHCDHAGCFMQAAYYEKYVIDYNGNLSSQVGRRSIDLSLNSAHNNSAPSAPATATPRAPTIPGVPTGITTTASNGMVTLSWTAPTDDGGGIGKYQYCVDKHNDGTWSDDWIDVPSNGTSLRDFRSFKTLKNHQNHQKHEENT